MKKYFYLSVLLAVFTFSGCTNKEEATATTPNNSIPTKKNIAIVLEPTALNLTKKQKQTYYQKYVSTIENINSKSDENLELELKPITAFLNEDWIEVEDFEKLATERANASTVVLEKKERYSPTSVPKTVTLKIGMKERHILFNASFNTQLNEDSSKGGQLFSAFKTISSELADTNGTWTQFGYEVSLADSETTYNILVSGKYAQNGIISSHHIEMKFYCDKNGGIR